MKAIFPHRVLVPLNRRAPVFGDDRVAVFIDEVTGTEQRRHAAQFRKLLPEAPLNGVIQIKLFHRCVVALIVYGKQHGKVA